MQGKFSFLGHNASKDYELMKIIQNLSVIGSPHRRKHNPAEIRYLVRDDLETPINQDGRAQYLVLPHSRDKPGITGYEFAESGVQSQSPRIIRSSLWYVREDGTMNPGTTILFNGRYITFLSRYKESREEVFHKGRKR